jgi:Protein of unknown function (DUF2934)/Pentapeptide repeats (8 copies)
MHGDEVSSLVPGVRLVFKNHLIKSSGVRMRSSVTLVRNLSLLLKNLKLRSAQFWNSDRSRHARDWVANRVKHVDSRISEVRLGSPAAFWTALLGIVLFAIVVAIVSGAAAGVLAAAAAIALVRHFAQTEADRQRRIVESFSKAVEQLGSDKLEVRVGAIFALERLSRESPDDYWTIMEVLTAFVREHMRYTTIMARLSERAYFLWLQAGRPEGRSQEFWTEAVRLGRLKEPPIDIASILTVIRRRSAENRQRERDNGWRFDLSETYLRQAFLGEVWLQGANFLSAHLEGANLMGAHLEGAFLMEAHLEGALLNGVHLEGAFLMEAHLEGALLNGAHLQDTALLEAHVEGAILTEAAGLADDQLLEAFGDRNTELPEGIARPKSWPPLGPTIP